MYDACQHFNGIGAVYTMCIHSRQHEVLTRAEWILASTGEVANVSVMCINLMSGHCGQQLNSIGAVYAICTHSRHHVVLTRAEWILTSTNAGQHLNSNGAVYTMCTHYHQHEVLTRAEWILASTDDTGPTFNRHCVGVGLYSLPAVCTARPACY